VKIVVHLKSRIRDPYIEGVARRYEERIEKLRGYKRVEGGTFHPYRKPFEIGVLLSPSGKEISTDGFASWVRQEEKNGRKVAHFYIGDADGWELPCEEIWRFSSWITSSEMTFLLLLEQIYRVLTILTGHPYHLGHTK